MCCEDANPNQWERPASQEGQGLTGLDHVGQFVEACSARAWLGLGRTDRSFKLGVSELMVHSWELQVSNKTLKNLAPKPEARCGFRCVEEG